MTKKILIIEDHPLFREGLTALLDRYEGYEVIGEAGTGREGLLLAAKFKPDLVLLDITLPGISGIQVARELLAELPGSKVLIVSMHVGINNIIDSFQAGATGYLTKESASGQLLVAMEALLEGKRFIDPSLSPELIDKIIELTQDKKKDDRDPYATLTAREQEIMRLLTIDRTIPEIANEFSLSPKTIENHRSNIFTKLGVRNKMELYQYSMKIGLVDA
ncbi:MAG: response regulator transcription factor [Desulfobulbaceae bacterium]|nr:response regulator transcription factor [Desulfobulbaceae bacterium]